jgi:hypothetical protein
VSAFSQHMAEQFGQQMSSAVNQVCVAVVVYMNCVVMVGLRDNGLLQSVMAVDVLAWPVVTLFGALCMATVVISLVQTVNDFACCVWHRIWLSSTATADSPARLPMWR